MSGLESKVVEDNHIIDFSQECVIGVAMNVAIGETVYVNSTFTSATEGMYRWEHTSSLSNWTPNIGTAFDDPSLWVPVYIGSTPSHQTISLDNSNSPAVKFIESIAEDDDGMAHYQVFAQEMAYNGTTSAYDGDDEQFTQLTNGTLTDDNANVVKTIVASTPLNKYIGDK